MQESGLAEYVLQFQALGVNGATLRGLLRLKDTNRIIDAIREELGIRRTGMVYRFLDALCELYGVDL